MRTDMFPRVRTLISKSSRGFDTQQAFGMADPFSSNRYSWGHSVLLGKLRAQYVKGSLPDPVGLQRLRKDR
jgi:hypothetical protein